MAEITETMLDELRARVGCMISQKRFFHTVCVESMAARLSALFCPAETMKLRAAALLHDITKELNPTEQEALCNKLGLPVTDLDRFAPKTFHARTAAALIPVDFPQFNDQTVTDAVRYHTTGHAEMTLTEKLLYLADYIDDSRKFENCVMLRRFFWGAEPEKLDEEGRLRLLRQTLLLSYDMTVKDLLAEHLPVTPDTMEARNELVIEEAKAKQ